MFRLLLLMSFVLVFTAPPVFSQEVVLAKGKILTAESINDINTGAMKVGAELNFKLTADIAGSSGTISKDSEIYGRVVDVVSAASDGGNSSVVVMFDFLKDGDDFYMMSALVTSAVPEAPGVSYKESSVFEGGTVISKKGADVIVAKGTVFKIQIFKDVTK